MNLEVGCFFCVFFLNGGCVFQADCIDYIICDFSITRCCKVGEKTAKKQMTCSMDEHAAERSRNYAHRAKLAMLSERAQVILILLLIQF